MKLPSIITLFSGLFMGASLNAATFFINFENSAAGGSVVSPVASSGTWTNFSSGTGNGTNITSSVSQSFGPGYTLSFTGSQYSDSSWNFRAFSRDSTDTVNGANFVARKSAGIAASAIAWTITGIPAGSTVRVYGIGVDGGTASRPLVSFGGDPAVSITSSASSAWETTFSNATTDAQRLATFTYIGDFVSTGVGIDGTFSVPATALGTAATADWNAIAIEVIPEPSTALLGIAGLLPLLRRRR